MAAFTGTPVDGPVRAKEKDYATKVDSHLKGSVKYIDFDVYTHSAGAGTGEINLGKLPAGTIRIIPDLCRIITSQFGANADLHIGHRAYTQEDGTVIAEDDNEWLDNADAGGGALDTVLTDGGTTANQYNSKEGIEVFAMVDTGNIEDTDTIRLIIAYMGREGI